MVLSTKPLILTVLSSLLIIPCFGQGNRLIDHNSVGWYQYTGDHTLAKRWKLHTEYQWRRIGYVRAWQQSLARLGLVYGLTDRVKVSGGYTHFTTYPYGRYPTAGAGVPFPEHRLYEDIQISDSFGRLKLAHRLRLEQRWIGQLADANPRRVASWTYQNRIRYQVSGTVPLRGATIDDGELYLNFFDELFISFGRNVGDNVYNQNRISGGFGYQVSNNLKLELNYLNQIAQHPKPDPISRKAVFEINNGFRLNVSYDIDFSRR